MKTASRQIAVLALILLAACALCRLLIKNEYTAYYPLPVYAQNSKAGDFAIVPEGEGEVWVADTEVKNGYLRVRLQAREAGSVSLSVEKDGDGVGLLCFRAGRLGTVYDRNTGGFTGDWIVLVGYTLFWLLLASITFRAFLLEKGPGFYAYTTIYSAGMTIFASLTGLTMLASTVHHLTAPYEFNMFSVYARISGASFAFVMITAPLVCAFALAMTVSNVALLRHERLRVRNVLALGVGFVLLAGEAAAYLWYGRDFSGSETEWRLVSTLRNSYGTVLAYFECMLTGTVICGVKAARHVPSFDRDYLIILGCRFRRDGSLTPLLRGRVDKALWFWHEQKKATGREAVFVPSGGRGPDEPMSEAEAMRRYLMENGVREELIRVENASRNTYQNMEFSKALIESETPDAGVAYVTTNYHVFRSGVWAARSGLAAEGLGSKTAWWYWPNAFMREWAGLMKSRLVKELILLAVLLAFFGVLSMAL